MTTIELVHTIPCDARTFWTVTLAQDFNQWLYRELAFQNFVEVERVEGLALTRRVHAVPSKASVPPYLRGVLGASLGYTEEGQLYEGRYRFSIRLDAMPERVTIRGEIRFAEGRRTVAVNVDVRVPIIAKPIEAELVAGLRRDFDRSAALTEVWLLRATG